MSDQMRRLLRLQAIYRRPPAWTVHFTERAPDGRLLDIRTGEDVTPGPFDTVVVFGTSEGGPRQTTEPPAT